MMRRDLIAYRMERANESFDEAELMRERGHFNTVVNRAYYAAFYGVTALLESEGLASAKHSGVRAPLNQHFISPGRIPKELGRAYADLFEDRQEGDYADLIRFDEATAAARITQARAWLDHLAPLIETWLKEHS